MCVCVYVYKGSFFFFKMGRVKGKWMSDYGSGRNFFFFGRGLNREKDS